MSGSNVQRNEPFHLVVDTHHSVSQHNRSHANQEQQIIPAAKHHTHIAARLTGLRSASSSGRLCHLYHEQDVSRNVLSRRTRRVLSGSISLRSLMRNIVNDLPATKRRRLAALPAAAIALALATAPTGPPPDLDDLLGGAISQNAFWGVYVQHVETGETWYEHNASNAFLPASNQKIFTSATALDALGSDYRYRTVLYFDGQVEGEALKGDLVLRGSGDPTFGSEHVRRGDPLRIWARDLANMGITRIEGRIVGDDNAFDDQPYAEGWDIDFVTSSASREVGVSIGGLAYNDNVVLVHIQAGSPGRPARVSMRPDGFLDFRNRMITANRRRGIAITIRRDFRSERITLEGSLPRTYNGTVGVPVSNPTAFAAATFAQYLREAGIEVQGEPVDIDDLNDFRYDRDDPLFVYVSPPLLDILRIVNKESNNFYAEQVFRTYASNGSAQGAENRAKQLLRRAGAATRDIEIRDGSGLSRKNMITPRAMGNLLTYMHGHEQREAFLASLARGGERGSTLRYRLNRVPVRAKTGSLEFVRSLSGYVTTQDGQTLAFAVFANNCSGPSYLITQTIDRIVMELAASSSPS